VAADVLERDAEIAPVGEVAAEAEVTPDEDVLPDPEFECDI
jgi:hypothetical protein